MGSALQEPGERDLHRGCAKASGDLAERRRLERREATEREERNVGDAARRELIDERVVATVCQVVEVLDADDLGELTPFGDLGRCDVAEADMADEASPLKPARAVRGASIEPSAGPKGSNITRRFKGVEHLEPEVSQILVNLAFDISARKRRVPSPPRATNAADLGDDDRAVSVWVKRLATSQALFSTTRAESTCRSRFGPSSTSFERCRPRACTRSEGDHAGGTVMGDFGHLPAFQESRSRPRS